MISLAGLRLRRLHLAAAAMVSVIVFSVFFMGSVTAYVGHSPFLVSLTSASVKSCSDGATITATVRDAKTGKPVKFQTVFWSFGSTKSSKDKISPRSSNTNSAGHASTGVRFGPTAGTRTIYATVGGFKSRTTASCAQAAQPTPKPTRTPKPTQPTKTPTPTPKPTHRPTQRPAQETPSPTPKPTKKPHHETPAPTPFAAQPTPTPTLTAVPATAPAGGITPVPSETTTAVINPGSSGDPAAAATNPPTIPQTDVGRGSGGGGFDLGLLALLVIGALGALVVIFLVRQPSRVRR